MPGDDRNRCGVTPPAGPQPVPALAGLRAYQPPAPDAEIDLRLDGTERRGLPGAVTGGLRQVCADDLSRYPNAASLERTIAERNGVAAERVVITAGADEALDRVCRAVLNPERWLVVATPTFEMLPHYARLAGAPIEEIPWLGGSLPCDAIGAAVCTATAVIAVVSPNNPTGAVVTADEVARLAAIDPNVLVVVDQAYGEFADADLTPVVAQWPNVLSVRTFSKAYGLSGCRVGYAVGPADVIGWMRAAGGPYAVARPSLAIAAARYADDADVAAYVARVRTERAALGALLSELGAAPLPSQANFVLCKFDDAPALDASLAAAGIAVRQFPANPALEGYRRITCPADPSEFDRLTAALRAALKGA